MLYSLFRFILAFLSGLSLILGAVISAMGIWLIASKDKIRSLINLIDTSKLPDAVNNHKTEVEKLMNKYDIITTVGAAVLIIGMCIAFIAICGVCGAFCEVKVLLLMYAIITGILFIALVIAIVYFGTLKARLNDEILRRLAELQENYLVSLISLVRERDTAKAVVTAAMNFMQLSLKCCGIKEIGDARNSTSWLASERRLLELVKEVAPAMAGDAPEPLDQTQESLLVQSADLSMLGSMASGKDIPAWLRVLLPASISELPPEVRVPKNLPPGFSLPADFKDSLSSLSNATALASELAANLTQLLGNVLTIRTPITCCQISGVEKLLKGELNVKQVYENVQEAMCAMSSNNTGIYQQTCHQALLGYIYKYQKAVVITGFILAVVTGLGAISAVYIFFCD